MPSLALRPPDGLASIPCARESGIVPQSGDAAFLARFGGFFVLAVLLVLLLVFHPPFFALLGWMIVATVVQWYCARALAS